MGTGVPLLSARADDERPTPSSAIIGCSPSSRFGVDQWPRPRRVANHGGSHVAQSSPPQLAGRPRRAPSRRGRRGRGRSAAGSAHAQPSAKGSGGLDSCRLRTALGVGEERWVCPCRRRCGPASTYSTTSRPCVPPAALPAPRGVPAGASAPPFWTSRTTPRLGARRCRSRRWAA